MGCSEKDGCEEKLLLPQMGYFSSLAVPGNCGKVCGAIAEYRGHSVCKKAALQSVLKHGGLGDNPSSGLRAYACGSVSLLLKW